jgi:acylphosphatase
VQNRADGTVAAAIEGPEAAVEALVAWCHHGPEAAVVSSVQSREVPPLGEQGFSVRD